MIKSGADISTEQLQNELNAVDKAYESAMGMQAAIQSRKNATNKAAQAKSISDAEKSDEIKPTVHAKIPKKVRDASELESDNILSTAIKDDRDITE